VAFTYLKVKSAKCFCLLQWSWSCYFGLGLECHLSRSISEKRKFKLKIAKFSYPRAFCAPAEGVPIGIVYQHWGQKSRMMGLPG